ncbi:50S ribosomal protein L18a [Candidatus Micrarchaeota archaeon]|nr:50S ribosomal protein L18a [Candidatus Micrarchaeota archaeon]
MKYSIDGEMSLKGVKRKFHKEVQAENQKRALEAVYVALGSNHRMSRKNIAIASVQEVK